MQKRKKLSTHQQGPEKARRQIRLGAPKPPAKLLRVQRKLGKRIAALRKQKGLTTVQFASDCGLSTVKIERIESGQVNISLHVILRLVKRLGLTVSEILRGIQ